MYIKKKKLQQIILIILKRLKSLNFFLFLMNHEERISLAKRVTDYLLDRHKDVVAVCIQGSTAHNEDREYSDLEMVVITKGESDTDFYQLVYEGIVVEIEFISEKDVRRIAASADRNWPFSADGWINCLSMHDEKQLLPEVAVLTANPAEKNIETSMRRAMTEMCEDLGKIRNFASAKEHNMVRFMSPFIAYNAARFLSLLNRQYYNGTRNLLTKPKEFEKLPEHFWDDYPALLTVSLDAEELIKRSERLYKNCYDLWRKQGHDFFKAETFEKMLELGHVLK